MSWDRPFDQLVPLPSGPSAPFGTRANFIKKLPKADDDSPKWRPAVHFLIDAAENRGPMMFAGMGLLRVANARKLAPSPELRRKRAKANGLMR